MNTLIRGLSWPIVALLIVGGTHLVAEATRPALQAALTPGAMMPIYLIAGAWAGWGTRMAGGTFLLGLAAVVLLGLMPVVLQVVGFGMILGRDGATVATSAAVGFLGIFWGGVLGSGIAASGAMAVASPTAATRGAEASPAGS